MTHTPATAGPTGTGPATADDPLFAPRKLCDGCYEQVTGLPAECLDLCSLSLDHAGLCDPRTETDQPCDRCGETGHRLTEHEPQDAMEAAACLPLDIPARIAHLEAVAAGCSTIQGDGHCDDGDCPRCEPARARELTVLHELAGAEFDVTYWVPTQYRVRVSAVQAAATLHRAGWPDEAVTALRIATGDITDGDAIEDVADDTAPNGPDLHSLAYAVRKASDDLGVAGPEGEAADWDTPETYHVYVLPGPPAAGTDGQTACEQAPDREHHPGLLLSAGTGTDGTGNCQEPGPAESDERTCRNCGYPLSETQRRELARLLGRSTEPGG